MCCSILCQIKCYNPDPSLVVDGAKASEVLLKVFESSLEEFDLSTADPASGTTDSGSDVKAMCVNGLGSLDICWDWCVSHLATKASEHAFGVSADSNKFKNTLSREIIRLVIKVMERLNKSPTMRAKFEGLQVIVVMNNYRPALLGLFDGEIT